VSHDGSWLALGGLGGGVEIRRMDALDQVPMQLPAAAPPRQDDAEVWALQFSPDDRWLAALTRGQGRLWRLRVDELMQLACDATGRNLEFEEWERYLGDLQYRFTCSRWELGPHYLEYARREAERGSFEKAVRLLSRAKALIPALPFEPLAEATRISVEGVLGRGRSLARHGQSDAALAEFGRIRQIDPHSSFDPAREMERVKRAGELVLQAAKQAQAGELEPAIAKYREALELDPGLSIDPVGEASKIYAPVLAEQGRALATEGRMEEAVELLERAVLLDPKAVSGPPDAAARNARAHALARQAAKLADKGELQGAIAGYRAALAVDDRLAIDPEAEASKRVAVHWMDEAYSRLSEEELLGAIERFEQARKLDPAVDVRAYSANDLCWAAVQHGYAKQALGVCNAAVASDDDSWMARDSRGVARVLVGDTAGAIEDFEFYVRASDRHDSVEQRKRWIVRLKAGWRPQSFAELDSE
jgi:tetratricopeptide (TPR) repeat protein